MRRPSITKTSFNILLYTGIHENGSTCTITTTQCPRWWAYSHDGGCLLQHFNSFSIHLSSMVARPRTTFQRSHKTGESRPEIFGNTCSVYTFFTALHSTALISSTVPLCQKTNKQFFKSFWEIAEGTDALMIRYVILKGCGWPARQPCYLVPFREWKRGDTASQALRMINDGPVSA